MAKANSPAPPATAAAEATPCRALVPAQPCPAAPVVVRATPRDKPQRRVKAFKDDVRGILTDLDANAVANRTDLDARSQAVAMATQKIDGLAEELCARRVRGASEARQARCRPGVNGRADPSGIIPAGPPSQLAREMGQWCLEAKLNWWDCLPVLIAQGRDSASYRHYLSILRCWLGEIIAHYAAPLPQMVLAPQDDGSILVSFLHEGVVVLRNHRIKNPGQGKVKSRLWVTIRRIAAAYVLWWHTGRPTDTRRDALEDLKKWELDQEKKKKRREVRQEGVEGEPCTTENMTKPEFRAAIQDIQTAAQAKKRSP